MGAVCSQAFWLPPKQMRPSSRHLVDAVRAYANAKAPTPDLAHAVAAAVAQDFADSFGGRVDIALPIGLLITRWPAKARSA
jgi:hypothetical protein